MSEEKEFKDDLLQSVYKAILRKIELGVVIIPTDYSVVNALQSAWFIIKESKCGKSENYKPVLEICTKESISEALFKMVTEGLNPSKKQCSFIPRGKKLTYNREYQGDIALAKRYSNVRSVNSGIYYKGDKLVIKREIDGTETLITHEQPIENLDNEILGAYAVVVEEDGITKLTKMTRAMIQRSWDYPKTKTITGYKKGTLNDTQKDFEDQMCAKTVIKRACKPYINASSDENIIPEENNVIDENAISNAIVANNTNKAIEKPKDNIIDAKILEEENIDNHEPVKQPNVEEEAKDSQDVEMEF